MGFLNSMFVYRNIRSRIVSEWIFTGHLRKVKFAAPTPVVDNNSL